LSVATQQKLVERIWARDATVWTGAGEDKWLGWLDEPRRMLERVGEITEFATRFSSTGSISRSLTDALMKLQPLPTSVPWAIWALS